jgi:hypothetical protein
MANNLEVGIKLNDGISANLNRINGNLNNLRGSVDRVNQSTSKIGDKGGIFKQMLGAGLATSAITGGIDILIGAAAKLGTAVFNAYTNSENYLTKLTGMLGGNAEAAKRHAKELQEFAKTTPFGLEELQKADAQMMAYGYSADEVVSKMRMIGDVASGAGADVGEVIRVMGQIKSKGKADTNDLMQLQERGIPALVNLQKQLGVTGEQLNKMIQSGQIGEKEVTKVFESITSEGGLFYKAMELQSKTLTGRISNFMDSLTPILVKIGETLRPVIDQVLNFVEGLMNGLDTAALSSIATAFASIVGVAVEMLIPTLDVLMPILDLLGYTFVMIADVIKVLWDNLSQLLLPIFEQLKNLFNIIGPVIKYQLMLSFEMLKIVIEKTTKILKPLAGYIGTALEGIGKVYVAIIEMINKVLEYFNLETIKLPKAPGTNIPDKQRADIKEGVAAGHAMLRKQFESKKTGTNKPKVDTIASQQPKIINVNVLSGPNASLIQKMDVTNIIDKTGKLTQEFKNEIESYLLNVLLEGTTNYTQ